MSNVCVLQYFFLYDSAQLHLRSFHGLVAFLQGLFLRVQRDVMLLLVGCRTTLSDPRLRDFIYFYFTLFQLFSLFLYCFPSSSRISSWMWQHTGFLGLWAEVSWKTQCFCFVLFFSCSWGNLNAMAAMCWKVMLWELMSYQNEGRYGKVVLLEHCWPDLFLALLYLFS